MNARRPSSPRRSTKRRRRANNKMSESDISALCSLQGVDELTRSIKQSSSSSQRLAAITTAVEYVFPRYEESLFDACIHEGLASHLVLKIGHVVEVLNLPWGKAPPVSNNTTTGTRLVAANAFSECIDRTADKQFIEKTCIALHTIYNGCSMHARYWSYREIGRETVFRLMAVIESQIRLAPIKCRSTARTTTHVGELSETPSANEGAQRIIDESTGSVALPSSAPKLLRLMTESGYICEVVVLSNAGPFAPRRPPPFSTLVRILVSSISTNMDLQFPGETDNDDRTHSDDGLTYTIGMIVNIARACGQNAAIRKEAGKKMPLVLKLLDQIVADDTQTRRGELLHATIAEAQREIDWFLLGTSKTKESDRNGHTRAKKRTFEVCDDEISNIVAMIVVSTDYQLCSPPPQQVLLDTASQVDFLLQVVSNSDKYSTSVRLSAASGIMLVLEQNKGSVNEPVSESHKPQLLERLVALARNEEQLKVERKLIQSVSLYCCSLEPLIDKSSYHSDLQLLIVLMKESDDVEMLEQLLHAIYRQACNHPKELGSFRPLVLGFSKLILDRDITRRSKKYAASSFQALAQERSIGAILASCPHFWQAMVHSLRQSLLDVPENAEQGTLAHQIEVRDILLEAIMSFSQQIPLRRRLAKQQGLMSTLIRFARNEPNDDVELKERVRSTLVTLTRSM